jgi:ankyrin repeat protein
MNRTLVITFLLLTNIAAPMMAMDASEQKINRLLNAEVTVPAEGQPINDTVLFGENPLWVEARSWSQEDKNRLLQGTTPDLENRRFLQHEDARGHIALAVAVGADPNQIIDSDKRCTTALMRCLHHFDNSLAQYLLEKKASPNKEAGPFLVQFYPLAHAETVEMTQLLLAHGAQIPENILCDIVHADTTVMEFYLKMGIRPITDTNGSTALFKIAYSSDITMKDRALKARMLIEAGVDLCVQNKIGNTALHHTAQTGGTFWSLEDLKSYAAAEAVLCSVIIDGCKERYQRYQERLTLLCCLNRVRNPLYGQRPLCRARFGWRSQDRISPFQLLSIKNNTGKIPHELWSENEELNPAKYAPAQDAKKNEAQPLLEN